MRREDILVLSFSLLLLWATRSEGVLGGWTPLQQLNERHVVDIANYAVSEYNKRSGTKLKLVRLVKGETQVVAGTNYRLLLNAMDQSATPISYQAVVLEKPWIHYKNLTSFQPFHS